MSNVQSIAYQDTIFIDTLNLNNMISSWIHVKTNKSNFDQIEVSRTSVIWVCKRFFFLLTNCKSYITNYPFICHTNFGLLQPCSFFVQVEWKVCNWFHTQCKYCLIKEKFTVYPTILTYSSKEFQRERTLKMLIFFSIFKDFLINKLSL